MRKIGFIFLFISIIFTLGCNAVVQNSTQFNPKMPTAFEGNCTVNYQGMEVKVHILRETQQSCIMSITEPQSLNGLKIEYDNDELYLSYGIIKQKLNTEKIPQAAFAPMVINVLDKIAGNLNTQPVAEGESFIFNLESSYGDIEVKIDKETEKVKTISIPDQDIFIVFDSFAKL